MATEDQVEQLVNDHFELAETLARNRFGKVSYYGLCFDDWLSDAMLGLLEAAKKFDTSRNVRFQTFATFRINGAMIDGERNRDHLSRVERRKVKQGEQDDVSIASIFTTLPDHCARYEDVLSSPEPEIRHDDFGTGLKRCLTAEEVQIVRWYHFDDVTMKEIGKRLGLSESRMSQRLSHIRDRLRERGRSAVEEMLT